MFLNTVTSCLAWVFISLSAFADNYPPSHVGPTSAEESMLLWMEGKSSFEKAQYRDAIRSLQRLVDRYPGTKAYTQAHYFLGVSYLKAQDPSKALAPLKYYVQSNPGLSDLVNGKLALSRAYSESRKFHEGLLASEEVLELHRRSPLKPDAFAEALLLKAHAFVGLKKWGDLTAVLDTFQSSQTQDVPSKGLQTEALYLQALGKSQECSGFPRINAKGRAKEADVRADMVKRGNCLLELQNVIGRAMELHPESPWITGTRAAARDAFSAYEKACRTPPPPLHTVSPTQLKRYRAELADALKRDCAEVLAKKRSDL